MQVTGQPERLSDEEIRIIISSMVNHPWSYDIQNSAVRRLIADLRATRAELRRLEGVRDAMVEALTEVADHEDVSITVVGCNLLYAVQAAVRQSPLEMGLPDDPYERTFRAIRALIATTPPDGAL